MLQEHSFNTGVVSINYAKGPDNGKPLILLHGGGGYWQDFMPIIPNLVPGWQVFALDMRGHGKSDRVSGKYRPDEYVPDILAFIAEQFREPMVLFGHSLGGLVALMTAAQLGEKSQALILGDPPLNIERFLKKEGSEERIIVWKALYKLLESNLSVSVMTDALAELYGMDREQVVRLAEKFSQVDPGVCKYHAEGKLKKYMAKVDVDGCLREISCPVLLIQADPAEGGAISNEDAKRAMDLLAEVVHVKLTGVGHGMGLVSGKIDHLLLALTDFLEKM